MENLKKKEKPSALHLIITEEEADAVKWLFSMYYQMRRINFVPVITNRDFPKVAPNIDEVYMSFTDKYHKYEWCKNPFCGHRNHPL